MDIILDRAELPVFVWLVYSTEPTSLDIVGLESQITEQL